jgi:hypothetical protein
MNPSPAGWPLQRSPTPNEWFWTAENRRVIAGDQWPVAQRLYQIAGTNPSYDLNFARTKTLNDTITGRNLVTFIRAQATDTGSTYVAADGLVKTAAANEPRFDHRPTTGESLGLLVEEARTNLWQWSNSATNGQTWSNVGTHLTLTAGQTSPAGDSTAIRAADVDNATSGTFLQRTTVAPALTANTFVSYSIFVKPISAPNGTISLIVFANGTTDSITGIFTVTGTVITGTASTSVAGTGASVSASYVAYPNGWYRLTVSGIPSTVTMADCRVRINLGSYTRSTGTARFDWYGGQFENNAFASSYFPNAGTLGGVTRAADVASITGSNFSSFYNQTEGTVFASYAERAFSVAHQIATVSNGTSSERISLAINTSNVLDVGVISGGTDTFAGNTPTLTAQQYQIGFGYKADNSGVSANGSAITVDSAVTLPTVSQLDIGARSSSQILNSTIKRLTYWPVRLSNTTLQQLTTP